MLGLPRLRVACLPSPEGSSVMAETLTIPGFNEPPDHHSRDVAGLPGMPVATSADHLDSVRPESRSLDEDRGHRISAPSVLLGIYVAGVVILSLRLIRSLVVVAQLKRTALAVTDPILDRPPGILARSSAHRPTVFLGLVGSRAIPDVAGLAPAGDHATVPQDDSAPPDAPVPRRCHPARELARLRGAMTTWNLLQHSVQSCTGASLDLAGVAADLRGEGAGVRRPMFHWAGGNTSLSGGLGRRRGGSRPGSGPLDLDRDGTGDGPCLVLGIAPSALVDRADPSASACRLRWPGRVGSASSCSARPSWSRRSS